MFTCNTLNKAEQMKQSSTLELSFAMVSMLAFRSSFAMCSAALARPILGRVVVAPQAAL